MKYYRFWWDQQNIEHIKGIMTKLPEFQTEEDLGAWFDAHDTADYLDEMEPADQEFCVHLIQWPTRRVDLYLHSAAFTAIEGIAQRRGIPYQILIQTWLQEKLSQEAPDLLPSL